MMCFECSKSMQFGSSNFHWEFDLWFHWILGQIFLSLLSLEILGTKSDEIDEYSAPVWIFRTRCLDSNAFADLEMWSDEAIHLL